MEANLLVGGPPPVAETVGRRTVSNTEDAAVVAGSGLLDDRTEYVVAAFVLAALGLLIMFRVAGFNAVIATRVSVGG